MKPFFKQKEALYALTEAGGRICRRNAGAMDDVDLHELVQAHLNVNRDLIDALPKDKRPIV
jgi:hypothetical protein